MRELENTLERLVVAARGGTIDVADLPDAFRARPPRLEQPLFAGLPTLDEMEKRYLRHVLAEVKGNRSRAAEVLGIDRRTLYRMAERFSLDLGDEEAALSARPCPATGHRRRPWPGRGRRNCFYSSNSTMGTRLASSRLAAAKRGGRRPD